MTKTVLILLPGAVAVRICLLVLALACAVSAQEAVPAPTGTRPLSPAEEKAADLRLPQLDRSALNPERREPLKVKPDERNPFGMVALPSGPGRPPELIKKESEEEKLRRVLSNLRITGLSGGPGTYRAMIGSFAVGEGDTLPRMFADQAEKLTVKSITDREVLLIFAENDPTVEPRTLGLAVDLHPQVRSLLVGEVFLKLVPFSQGAADLPPLIVPSVEKVVAGMEEGDLQAIAERQYELLNAPAATADAPAD